ncbi:MAG: hypothetical protein V4733_00945 [Verrucomicrobiota bacterium]
MSSLGIGETIEQYESSNFSDAWREWATSAAAWIVAQKEYTHLEKNEIISEILNTNAQLLNDLHSVWLADFCPDLSLDVIQVIVIAYTI